VPIVVREAIVAIHDSFFGGELMGGKDADWNVQACGVGDVVVLGNLSGRGKVQRAQISISTISPGPLASW